MHNAISNSAFLLLSCATVLPAQSVPRLAWHTSSIDSVRVVQGSRYRTGAGANQRELAFAEVVNLPSMWNKADILRNHPKLAAYRSDPEFIERMR